MDEVARLSDALERILTFQSREEKWLKEMPGRYPW
jgi:hypothetical protein